MVNYTNISYNASCLDPTTCFTYNISGLLGNSAIDDPVSWISIFNDLMSGIFIIGLMIGIGVILYFLMKSTGRDDSDSITYSSIVIMVTSIMLFLVDTGLDVVKLITWQQLSIIVVIAVFSAGIGRMVKRY